MNVSFEPNFSFPPPFTVREEDGGTLDFGHTYLTCSGTGGRVKCTDTVGSSHFKADFRPLTSTPSVFRFKVHFQRIPIDAPFSPPVTVTITHNGAASAWTPSWITASATPD